MMVAILRGLTCGGRTMLTDTQGEAIHGGLPAFYERMLMSSISPVSSSGSSYPTPPKPAAAAPAKPPASDPDHDGDVDGKGLDVKG